jgi:hypothetical protein
MVIVTGFGPQSNVMMPPAPTAATTAADVQLAGVPCPITWSGAVVATAWPACGTLPWPAGLPAAGAPPLPETVAGGVVAACRAAAEVVRGAGEAGVVPRWPVAGGMPPAGTVATNAGTVAEAGPEAAFPHAVTVAIVARGSAARQAIPAAARTSLPESRIDPMAHDARPKIPGRAAGSAAGNRGREIFRDRVEEMRAHHATGTPWFVPAFASWRYGIRVVSKPAGAVRDRDECRRTADRPSREEVAGTLRTAGFAQAPPGRPASSAPATFPSAGLPRHAALSRCLCMQVG